MKIREKISGQILTVYGFYWHGSKTYFYCFPKHSYGISSYAEEEIDLVDRNIGDNFEYLITSQGMPGIFHKSLLEDDLMDELIEHSPQAYNKFITMIGQQP